MESTAQQKTAQALEHSDGSLQNAEPISSTVLYQKEPRNVKHNATCQDQWQIFSGLEQVCISIKQITSMAQAIEDAMLYSPNEKAAYYGAMSLLTGLLSNSYENLDQLVAQGFEALPNEDRRKMNVY